MSFSFSIRKIRFAACITAVAVCSAAHAEPIWVARVVSTHGLDLSSVADQAKLRYQIKGAARGVCGEVTARTDEDDFQNCVHTAFDSAWPQAETKIAAANGRAMVAGISTK